MWNFSTEKCVACYSVDFKTYLLSGEPALKCSANQNGVNKTGNKNGFYSDR